MIGPHPRATGNTADKVAARLMWHVRNAAGRLLASNETEKGARKTARVINQGRAEPVVVVQRGAR